MDMLWKAVDDATAFQIAPVTGSAQLADITALAGQPLPIMVKWPARSG
ncbi:hypothetical protein [Nonomuraea helvata]|uniref:Uncharacterized protein n=1 Tax=Nonomuraea helvata TaxID=37484 RepID=A0ABV5S0P3_9ACTN